MSVCFWLGKMAQGKRGHSRQSFFGGGGGIFCGGVTGVILDVLLS